MEAPAAGREERRPSFLEPGLGLHGSRRVVFRLSSLFALDAFAGGFVVQSFVAWWFHARFGADEGTLGAIFFGANVLAGVSALSAGWLARRIGLVNTMVFTHLPSNVLLAARAAHAHPAARHRRCSCSASPSPRWTCRRGSPTRWRWWPPTERSAAAGVTGIARTIGSSVAPLLAGPLFAVPALASVPFFVAGGLKIVYDLLLWRGFRKVKPPEEALRAPSGLDEHRAHAAGLLDGAAQVAGRERAPR